MARVILPGATGRLVTTLRTVDIDAVASATGHDRAALEALQRLSNAVGLNTSLGTALDDTLVKDSVRAMMGLGAGEDPSGDDIRAYVDEIRKIHRPDPAPTATATSPAATDPEEPLFGRPLPGFGWWFGLLAVVATISLVVSMDTTGWMKWVALALPAVVWLVGAVSPRFRNAWGGRALIAALVVAFILASTAGVQRIFAPPAGGPVGGGGDPAVGDPKGGTPKGDTSKKAAPKMRDPLLVDEGTWKRHRAQAPEYIKALEDLIEGPEGREVAKLAKDFAAAMDAANAKVGTKVAADADLTREWDDLKRSKWYTADEAVRQLGIAKRFVKSYLGSDVKEVPDYMPRHFDEQVGTPGKWAQGWAETYRQRSDKLKEIVSKAAKVKEPAPKPVDDVLEAKRKADAAALLQKLADAKAARKKLLESQWDLAFDDEALAYLGDIVLPKGTKNEGVLSGKSLRAWQYARLGPAMKWSKTFNDWFWSDADPAYWQGKVFTLEKHVTNGKAASAKADPDGKGRNAEERFLAKYGKEYGFKSLHDFFLVVAYVNPNRFISHDAAKKTQEAITAAVRKDSARLPADFQQPVWGRFDNPAPALQRLLRDAPHPRPEVEARTERRLLDPFVGLTKDEWVRQNMKD